MAPAAGLHWHEVFVLPRDTHGADLMTILVVVTPLPPAVNVPDLEGYLQTKPVTLERSSAASPFPRRPVPLAQVLDQGGRLAAVMTTLPRRRLPQSQGRNLQWQWPLVPWQRDFPDPGKRLQQRLFCFGTHSRRRM